MVEGVAKVVRDEVGRFENREDLSGVGRVVGR